MAAIVPWLLALTARWSHRLQQIQRLVSEIAQGQLQPGNTSPTAIPATTDTTAALAPAQARPMN